MKKQIKILIPGGAGLVGQNLIFSLKKRGYENIVVLDKHQKNLGTLREIHPDIKAEFADLAEPGPWQREFIDTDVVVMLQAQIGGNDYQEFVRNNILSTELILAEMEKNQVPYLVHLSSSVIESVANDFYKNTKKEQEELVLRSRFDCAILRPTLMFGWFDRKHLGWLSRFMQKTPIFPIPGDGKYLRQPMFVGDFCEIVVSCIENRINGVFNISGLEHIDYIDIIKGMKKAIYSRVPIVKIPYRLFYILLFIWGLFDKNPPFTTQQLTALTAHDVFEVIDWPGIFGVEPTPFQQAVEIAFADPVYSKIILEF